MRYTPQQRQENISRKQIGEFLEQFDFITSDIYPDYGEDVYVRIYENGESTGLSFCIQAKSAENITDFFLASGELSYQLETKDIIHWSGQTLTVIIVIWDVKKKMGFWIWIKDAIQYLETNNPTWRKNDGVNIHIPLTNVFDKNGLTNIRHLLAELYYPIVSKDKELQINARFSFPPTEEGKLKFEELKRHFSNGDEIEIDGAFIDKLDFPDWWKRLFGEFDTSGLHLIMGPTKALQSYPTQFFVSSTLGKEEIPYVELTPEKQGTDEITLTNESQRIPIKIRLVSNLIKKEHLFTLRTDYSGKNFTTILYLLRIQKILSVEANIRMRWLRTGEEINIPIPKGSFPPLEQEIFDFVEKICLIERTLGVEIQPQDDGLFSIDDLQAAHELISIINTGRNKNNGLVFTAELTKQGIIKVLEKKAEGLPLSFQVLSNESYIELLSQKIELGPVIQKIKGIWNISDSDIAEWLAHAKEDDVFQLKIEDAELSEEFPRWVK